MNRGIPLLFTLGLLLMTTHRLPAPISEIPEPSATASLKAKSKPVKTQSPRSAPQSSANVAASKSKDPGGHSALGFEAAMKRDYEKAIAEFSKAIEAEPGDTKNYYNRGTAYRGVNKLNEAFADFSRAIELGPQNAAAYIGRGEVRLVQKQLDPALADFEKALQIVPNDAYARRFRDYVLHLER